ncbi:acetyl-CoA carboxylase biotin carboxylase subunit [Emcibacter sp.]|uniref:acetyl-CoA carboxylase biotin carboxylase subunit n=1 Tax=Emcibacter sp. TaxID=1979954 RepID=UPI002AA7C5D9|nr:biotin carboxylase N-terminal domain-containing protein [Emcibacter sp.]
MTIQKLFIANRGEIALRIIRTARRLGINTVLGVSEADLTSLPAQEADEVVLLGPAPSAQSYLAVDKVVEAARSSGADAVHPGYGFLSENATFARKIIDSGMKFVGPLPEHLDAMGDKLKARSVAIDAGLPVVPGGEAETAKEAAEVAKETGYPLLIKAVSGGGGRGMKRVDDPSQLASQIDMAMAEAEAAFGDPRIYVERYIGRGRHVEVQVLGSNGKAVHLGTRDCSIQRRFQKLVEEAPAPNIPDDKRAAIEQAAVKLTRHLKYQGAGTVEFLVDAETYDFYFLEMNARIQVEHPVTEKITGLDLIEQQILIAADAPFVLLQENIEFDGHAIEVRINAEDPDADFRPSPGKVTKAAWPAGAGIRVDSHIQSGGVVPPNYDSLMGKLIVHAPSREEAVARTAQALSTLSIEGVVTTAPLHARIMADKRFKSANIDTRFFEDLDNG